MITAIPALETHQTDDVGGEVAAGRAGTAADDQARGLKRVEVAANGALAGATSLVGQLLLAQPAHEAVVEGVFGDHVDQQSRLGALGVAEVALLGECQCFDAHVPSPSTTASSAPGGIG